MLKIWYTLMLKHQSKLNLNSFLAQLIKFAFVGFIGTIVNLTILYTLTEFFYVYYIISEIIAFFISVINNYILNKIWTFKENIEERLIGKYLKYTIICLISLVVNISILFILVEFFAIWYIFAEVIAIMGGFLFNFIGNKSWTFRKNNNKLN